MPVVNSAAIEESSFLRYTWADFATDARRITLRMIRGGLLKRIDSVYGIPRGGLVFAVYCSHALRLPLIVNPACVTSRTLVVDDAILTGLELQPFEGSHTAVLVFHPFGGAARPGFVGRDSDVLPCFPWEADGAAVHLPVEDVIGDESRAGAY